MPESFEWLQRRHFELLQQERSYDERQLDYLVSQVNDFVSKLGEAGADIRDAERRTQLQDWLTHWQRFLYDKTGRSSTAQLKRPSVSWGPIALGVILLIILVAAAAILRSFFFQPSVPQVQIIALGGGGVLPADGLGILSPAEANAAFQESEISINPPTGGRTVFLDDYTAIRAADSGRMLLLDEVSSVSAAAQSDTVSIAIRAVAADNKSIDSMAVQIDDQSLGGSVPALVPVTNYTQDLCLVIDTWGSQAAAVGAYPLTPGSHTVRVIAWNSDQIQGESEAILLDVAYETDDWRLWKAVTSVEPCAAGQFPPITPLPSLVFTPPPKFTPTPTPTRPPSTPAKPCHDNAIFVSDVTVPDGTVFEPGTAFNKTWRLKNTGTCTWDTRYQLVFVGGAKMDAPDAVNVPQVVPPGGTVDITVPMVAPQQPGTYQGYWRMRNPDCGNLFGTAVNVQIIVRPGAGNLPVITRFEVMPNAISQGQQATLYWEYVNGTSARLYPDGQEVGASGSQVVSPNITTQYRLVVSNAAGSVERTTTLTVGTGPGPSAPPSSPANLTVTDVRPYGFTFTWVDTSVDEQGFRLYDADTRQAVAIFPANVTSGRIEGLDCGRTYGFYLVSYNERGESLPSNTVRASTSPCGG
jgi:hypothetical protein